ncbi:MAG: sporulation protein YunB [Clostridia bacterium]|nr:sporulation protein YunB [Clostridia bacterium]MBP3649077.1 sporulation protein YunB [Clostridia bacterium]
MRYTNTVTNRFSSGRVMQRIYSSGGMLMKETKKRTRLRWLVLVALAVVIVFLLIEQNLSQTLLDMAYATAHSIALETVNKAAQQVVGDEIAYGELMDVQTDSMGRVTMLRANTMHMNQIATQTAILAQEQLNSIENQMVDVPLGAALGIRFLGGFGPRVSVQIVPVGAVSTHFVTEFETAGINQTRHKIFLVLETSVSLIVPADSRKVQVTSTVPIAESIIVGQVPDSFVDVSDEEDMLNLIP